MKWLSNVFKESLEQILKETKVNLGSVLRRQVSPKQPSKYFIISSSSFSVSLPSLGITSNESLCHPPNLSTTREMKTIPSASHLSLYFPTDIEGMLDSVFFLTGDLSSKLLLKGSILAQRESRTSAGRSSLPGRSPAGSFRGPRAAWNAAVRRMKWSIRNKKWWWMIDIYLMGEY